MLGANEFVDGSFVGQATPPDGSFTSVSAGSYHTCGVKTDGSVACWGADHNGQSTPPVGSFASVSAGAAYVSAHTCGVKTDGSVACWGNNDWGRSVPPADSFTSVSAGESHTCGVKTDGSVVCWGSNESADHGKATPPEGSFSSVSASEMHTCGVKTDGSVVCWGNDLWGQSTPPVADDHLDSAKEATAITVGEAVQGTLGHANDLDYFAFEAEESGLYFIDVEGAVSYSVATLYDANGEELTSTRNIHWQAPGSGRYYVKVTGPDRGSYTLTVSSATDDHGNSAQEATSVAIDEDVPVPVVVDYEGDLDYLVFEVEEGRSYVIRMSWRWLSGSIEMALYDPDEKVLRREGGIPILFEAGRSGNYYVSMGGDSLGRYGTGSFTLTIESATSIMVGKAVEGVIDYEGDADDFVFEAEQGTVYQIDVELGTLSNSRVELYDRWTNELASNASRIVWTVPHSGHYDVKISSMGTGSYTLTIIVAE